MQHKTIISNFDITSEVTNIENFGSGHINDTYLVRCLDDSQNYVLQRINHLIFPDVALLQGNIKRITEHIRQKLSSRGIKDVSRRTLQIIPTLNGELFHFDGESYWRLNKYIEDSVCHEQLTPKLAYLTGLGIGEFQDLLSDLPGDSLGETIKDFHNISFRLEQLRSAVKSNPEGRLSKVQEIVDELEARSEPMSKAVLLHLQGALPKRVTHCDTKVSNILFDSNDELLCVIDLDTTMPGFVLSDFGDFIRTAANTGAEDEKDLSKIGLDTEIFKQFSRGYLESAHKFLSIQEVNLLAYGAQLMTYMQTVRFLTDYINGDTYYKVKYPEHNYVRSLAQLTLLHSIDKNLEEMEAFIKEEYEKVLNKTK